MITKYDEILNIFDGNWCKSWNPLCLYTVFISDLLSWGIVNFQGCTYTIGVKMKGSKNIVFKFIDIR
jgi:hypothetical protein